ncbi:hypothetical protein ACFX19_037719 [Malus domestica]
MLSSIDNLCWGAFCNGQRIHVSQTDEKFQPPPEFGHKGSKLETRKGSYSSIFLVGRSLLVTGFGYEQDDVWITNIELFKEFTNISRGVRRLSAAAVDMCHVTLQIVEAHWEYRLKPWDTAAGVLIVEEAGGKVTCMDGGKFSVFDRSILVSNCVLHGKLLERVAPATEKLKSQGIDFSLRYKPEDYTRDI